MMKKFTLSLFLLVFMLAGVGMANAANTDLGQLELNKVYSCPSFNYVTASFCPETTGVYKINYSSSDRFAIYTDAELTTAYSNGGEWAYQSEVVETMNSMGYETWNFEAGVTYYFGGSVGSGLFIMNSNAQFVITASSNEIEVSSVTPAEQSTISTGNTAQIDIAFNCYVGVESATVEVAGQTETFNYSDAADSKVRVYGNTVSVILKEYLQSLYDTEVITGGEQIKLTLNGLCRANDNSVLYGEDGKLTLLFKTADKPATLVSTVNTPDQMAALKTYYFEDDASGSISLTFNRQLLNDKNDLPTAVWGIGNKESETGDYYEEIIPCVVDGNTVTVNLQDKLRNTSTMDLSMDYTMVQLDIKNVKSADGQYVYSEGSGKLGSFNYMYDLEYVQTKVVAEFTPSKGEIAEDDEIEIWIMGDNDLRYEGIAFQCGESEIVVTEFTKNTDPDDVKASIITLKVPALEAENGDEVTVTLKNVKAADGLDHSKDVKATYTYKKEVSVDSIELQNEPVNVYNMQGIHIVKNGNVSELESLEKGIYIVNGKKVMVK